MGVSTLTHEEWRNRVHACWVGKNIGGTLGAPYEGPNRTHALTFYDPIPQKAAPNDDLDMQLGFLVHMEQHKRFPTLDDHVEIWKKYFRGYPWDEYGFCLRNLMRGLRPPLSGWFENSYIDNMGAPIRSEIWACLAPGAPQKAACLAWHDAVMDHAGGEGVWGEMFWAAVQSAAFVCDDTEELIEIGLAMIPPWSRISRVIRDVLYAFRHQHGKNVPYKTLREGDTWGQIRHRIVEWFGHKHGCHAVQNHGFTVLGWLLGKDFGDSLCKAVNCGCDADCTGATLGATLGILHNIKGIPTDWQSPVGDEIVLHHFTKVGCTEGLPLSIQELSERIVDLLPCLIPGHPFAAKGILEVDTSKLQANSEVKPFWYIELCSSQASIAGHLVTMLFPSGPVYKVNEEVELKIISDCNALPRIRYAGNDLPVSTDGTFLFRTAERLPRYSLEVGIQGAQETKAFVLLGSDEAKGYPAYVNIEPCPKCGARQPAGCKCDLKQ